MNYSENPQYDHDCDRCKFLGHVLGNDLYWCEGSDETIIQRHSSKDSDYSSGLPFGSENFFNNAIKQANEKRIIHLFLYREAMLRAIARNYISPDKAL
jgi:hypothetical protein